MDTYLIPFIVGLLSSVSMTACWRAIARDQMWPAILYEGAAIMVGIVAWQLWAATGFDWSILASEGVGTLFGTWLVMRR